MDHRELVALAAKAATRYDTSMAAAFRRALGILAPPGWGRRSPGAIVEALPDRDLRECFINRESPMDGLL